MPANGTKNLIPAKKGEARNPTGKNGSEERYLTNLIRTSAKEIPAGELWTKLTEKRPEFKGKTYGQLLEMILWEEAIIRREPQAIKVAIERCDGRMPLALTGEWGGPVLFDSPLKSKSDEELEDRIRQLEEKHRAETGKTANGKKVNGKVNGKRNGGT